MKWAEVLAFKFIRQSLIKIAEKILARLARSHRLVRGPYLHAHAAYIASFLSLFAIYRL